MLERAVPAAQAGAAQAGAEETQAVGPAFHYQHDSTLRLMMDGLGVTDLPGGAATAPDMTEFFK